VSFYFIYIQEKAKTNADTKDHTKPNHAYVLNTEYWEGDEAGSKRTRNPDF
jgi:hypothetical protein